MLKINFVGRDRPETLTSKHLMLLTASRCNCHYVEILDLFQTIIPTKIKLKLPNYNFILILVIDINVGE